MHRRCGLVRMRPWETMGVGACSLWVVEQQFLQNQGKCTLDAAEESPKARNSCLALNAFSRKVCQRLKNLIFNYESNCKFRVLLVSIFFFCPARCPKDSARWPRRAATRPHTPSPPPTTCGPAPASRRAGPSQRHPRLAGPAWPAVASPGGRRAGRVGAAGTWALNSHGPEAGQGRAGARRTGSVGAMRTAATSPSSKRTCGQAGSTRREAAAVSSRRAKQAPTAVDPAAGACPSSLTQPPAPVRRH